MHSTRSRRDSIKWRIEKARPNADKFHNISRNSIDIIERDTIFPRFTSMKIHLYESISNMTTFFSYFYLFIRFFVPFAWAWFRNCAAKRVGIVVPSRMINNIYISKHNKIRFVRVSRYSLKLSLSTIHRNKTIHFVFKFIHWMSIDKPRFMRTHSEIRQ